MSTELITLILTILVKYGPEAYMQVVTLLQKTEPTAQDWAALTATVNKGLHDK